MKSIEAQAERPTILIVDDTPENLMLMNALLGDHYRTKVANHGERALQIAAQLPPPDLILLDVMMPGIDGYEVCRRLKAVPATAHIPVIFLTASTDSLDQQRAFDVGAVDFISKPVSAPVVLARVRTHVELKTSRDELSSRYRTLEEEVARRTREVMAIQDVTIRVIGSLAETRDNETGNHIRRTQNYVRLLATRLSAHPRFTAQLPPGVIESLYKSAPLHDIGKVGIPDHILLKPDKLTPEEFEIMKTHTVLGREAIERAEIELGFEVGFLRFAKEIAQSHQEKWDGSGYPEGLVGEAIPLSARLMALADVYDALISKRVYKPAFSHDESMRLIANGRGTHFDPEIYDAFLDVADEFRKVAQQFADH
jgi:putative two-component system response regulator